MQKLAKLSYLSLAVVASLSLSGCGGGSAASATASASKYLGTQAPGDVWSWQLNDTTFSASNNTLGTHYSGAKSLLSTGFLKLTVTATDDTGLTTGSSAYALEFPGTALMIKPAGSDTKAPIVAGSLGTNPSGPQVSFNFVTVPSSTFDSVNDQAYGHVTFTVTGNAYDGTSHRWAIDGTALSDGPSNFTGANGLMTDTDNNATGAMTPSGVCVLDYGPGAGGVIGVKQPSANVDWSDFSSKSFRGFLINSGKTQCVAVTPNGDGTLHGDGYAMGTGVETGTFDGGGGVTISFQSQPNPGIVKIGVAPSGGGSPEIIAAAINQVNGKYMLFGFGYGSGKGYNVILVQQ